MNQHTIAHTHSSTPNAPNFPILFTLDLKFTEELANERPMTSRSRHSRQNCDRSRPPFIIFPEKACQSSKTHSHALLDPGFFLKTLVDFTSASCLRRLWFQNLNPGQDSTGRRHDGTDHSRNRQPPQGHSEAHTRTNRKLPHRPPHTREPPPHALPHTRA